MNAMFNVLLVRLTAVFFRSLLFVFSSFLCVNAAFALTFSSPRVYSYLGEPLLAEIDLFLDINEAHQKIFIEPLAESELEGMNMGEYVYFPVSFDITQSPKGGDVIVITSTLDIKEPFVMVGFCLRVDTQEYRRKLIFTLDPKGVVKNMKDTTVASNKKDHVHSVEHTLLDLAPSDSEAQQMGDIVSHEKMPYFLHLVKSSENLLTIAKKYASSNISEHDFLAILRILNPTIPYNSISLTVGQNVLVPYEEYAMALLKEQIAYESAVEDSADTSLVVDPSNASSENIAKVTEKILSLSLAGGGASEDAPQTHTHSLGLAEKMGYSADQAARYLEEINSGDSPNQENNIDWVEQLTKREYFYRNVIISTILILLWRRGSQRKRTIDY